MPDLSHVDAAQVTSVLTPVEDLADAAAQMAAELGVDAVLVRVRILAAGCTLCDLQANQGNATVAGLDLQAGAAQAKAGDTLYLFVGRFTCTYAFDGTHFTPQSCQWAPV